MAKGRGHTRTNDLSAFADHVLRWHARMRIGGEVVGGTTIRCTDGTVIRNGRVVTVGPRAIIDKNGAFCGLRPEEGEDR